MTTEKRTRLFSLIKKLGIGSGITIMGIVGGIWWAMGQGCEKVLDPHIRDIAIQEDSANVIPLVNGNRALIDSIRSDYKVIKSILEVLATNDQLLEAKRRRNGDEWRY